MKTDNISGEFSTQNKLFIREKWNAPLIKFLTRNIDDRLIYVGLPSKTADDVHQWIDHIKMVIAFQCREYGKASDPSQSREDIEELDSLLRKLERESKIDGFVVYDGYLEEVIFKGSDNSPNEIKFEIGEFITLYNLDFCNDIASPIEFVDKNGDIQKVYKINAIQKLLEIQSGLSKISNKFLFFLTVHCSYKGKELEDFLNNPPDDYIKQYLTNYYKLRGHEKNARIVRLFVCYHLHMYFKSFNFSCKILPVIKYEGINNTPLLHFSVIGVHPALTASGVPSYQSLNSILEQGFISINDNSFVSEGVESEQNFNNIHPVDIFTQTKTYKKVWQ
ncbi:hypothetical protein LJB98_01040 [Bacteroidales bacterium OttesenSCG-928-M11]|nr:hypothetical protein [Bacteroidales bacterium OttesenSCG-928-M11]